LWVRNIPLEGEECKWTYEICIWKIWRYDNNNNNNNNNNNDNDNNNNDDNDNIIIIIIDFKENDHFFWFERHVSTELLSSSVEWKIAKRVECWMGNDANWGK